MTNDLGSSLGGLLGTIILVDVLGNGVNKIDKALKEKKHKKNKLLENTEPIL